MNRNILDLLDIMARLRDPERGCPWDQQQNFASIAPYTVEEAYEVVDAIDRNDMDALRDELGDLLLQVVFHSQMARELDTFGWDEVVEAICDKMVRRHPHVFGAAETPGPSTRQHAWESAKEQERAERGSSSLMDEIPRGMAELQRAQKVQKRAARVGFDWPGPAPVVDKLVEEVGELREAMASGSARAIDEELGDLLFTAVNLSRQLRVDPGGALRRASAKFERRFRALEQAAGSRERLDRLGPEELEALWCRVKEGEAERGNDE